MGAIIHVLKILVLMLEMFFCLFLHIFCYMCSVYVFDYVCLFTHILYFYRKHNFLNKKKQMIYIELENIYIQHLTYMYFLTPDIFSIYNFKIEAPI